MYGKIFKSMFEGTMRGKSDVLLVWTNFIVNSDRDGFVDRTFRTISEETGLSIEAVEKAIIELESPDSESRSQELEGRRLERIDEHRNWGWRIVNYLKYSAIRSDEERREQNRIAQAKFRSKKNDDNSKIADNDKQPSAIVSNSKHSKPTSAIVSPLAVAVDITKENALLLDLINTGESQQNSECAPDVPSLESHKSISLGNQLMTNADMLPPHIIIKSDNAIACQARIKYPKGQCVPTTSVAIDFSRFKKEETEVVDTTFHMVKKFFLFWKAYPKKIKQGMAEQIWCDLFSHSIGILPDALFEQIMTALNTQKKSWDEPRYIPAPDNWLRDKRWLDELPKQETVQEQADRMRKEEEANDFT